MDLLKLSFFCDDPLYKSKRSKTLDTIEELQGVTSFSAQTVMSLDDGLKNKTIKLSTPLNRGDCIALISQAQDAVDRLYSPSE